jgi:hypothetical protein
MSSKRLTVSRVPRRASRTIPEIRFGGMWLSKLGFKVGDHVKLALENGRIVIRLEEISNMVEEAPGSELPEQWK